MKIQSLDKLQIKNGHHYKTNTTTLSLYLSILTFRNLTYSVKNRSKLTWLPTLYKNAATNEFQEKLLLNDVSGEAKAGEITAVIGASGSGKSTLINTLAGRMSNVKGSVTINGDEVLRCNTDILSSISAYVMQDVFLFPGLTVEETLMFSAELSLPTTLSKSQKSEKVQALIDLLGLRHAAKTVIGDEENRGVSGGERKRLSIGIEIIHGPAVLFLDEPTSNLDSSSAFLVVSVLKRIAQSGSIVILSVHQPSSRILNIMDHLIILSDGQSVYNGSPSNIAEFFATCNYPIPKNENKVEFVLDLISELKDDSNDGITSLVKFNKFGQKRNINQLEKYSMDSLSETTAKGKLVTSSKMVSGFTNPFWVETYVLAKRSLLNSKRMPKSFGFRFTAVILAGLMLATIFWRLDDSPKGIQERLGFFASAIVTTFFICGEAIPHFIHERSIFKRETSYNTYRTSSYVYSHTITALPSLVLFSSSFTIITFWAVRLSGGYLSFFWFFGYLLASFWTAHSFVTFVSSVVPHVLVGYVLVVTLLAQFTLFSGLFISRGQIPRHWIWFHYMSLVKYPYQGVLLDEFDNPVKCLITGIQMFDKTPLKDMPSALKGEILKSMSSVLGINVTTSTCVLTGFEFLQQLGVTDLSKLSCLWITILWGFFYRILFYVALLFGNKYKMS